jgi:hypothetical protein
METFTITTDREVADAIEKLDRAGVFLRNRSIRIAQVTHHGSYSVVQIVSTKENGLIEPKDIFWLGWMSSFFLKKY